MLFHGECHSLSAESHSLCHFPHTACKGQAQQNRCHPEAEYGFPDNHPGIHQVSAAGSQPLRCRNTVFRHEVGFLLDLRSFHHNKQVDDNHCFDNES